MKLRPLQDRVLVRRVEPESDMLWIVGWCSDRVEKSSANAAFEDGARAKAERHVVFIDIQFAIRLTFEIVARSPIRQRSAESFGVVNATVNVDCQSA